jgi:hypothetical protein
MPIATDEEEQGWTSGRVVKPWLSRSEVLVETTSRALFNHHERTFKETFCRVQ